MCTLIIFCVQHRLHKYLCLHQMFMSCCSKEPTSGLDYSTASSLVRTLRTITEAQKKTLVMTIHQPSSQMFFTFHDLLLLSDGQARLVPLLLNISITFVSKINFTMQWVIFLLTVCIHSNKKNCSKR